MCTRDGRPNQKLLLTVNLRVPSSSGLDRRRLRTRCNHLALLSPVNRVHVATQRVAMWKTITKALAAQQGRYLNSDTHVKFPSRLGSNCRDIDLSLPKEKNMEEARDHVISALP